MTTFTKQMIVASALIMASGTVQAADNSSGFWRRAAQFCCCMQWQAVPTPPVADGPGVMRTVEMPEFAHELFYSESKVAEKENTELSKTNSPLLEPAGNSIFTPIWAERE